MRATILSILLVFGLCGPGVSQPTMTRDWVGSPGDEFSINFATSVPSEGAKGADQAWDFAGILGDTITARSSYANVEDTPYTEEFPESNLALGIDAFGVFSYLNIDNNIMEDLGNGNPVSLARNSDPRTILEFPLTFGDSFTDTYASSVSGFGVTTYTTGTISASVDAYGTVELPGGTFENCLRIEVVEESVDSTDLGLGIVEKIHSTVTSYYWYTADSPGPLCYLDYTESYQVAIVPPLPNDTMVFPSDSTFVFDPDATVSHIVSFEGNPFEMKVAPNPAPDIINLYFSTTQPDVVEFSLKSVSGQTVHSHSITPLIGENTIRIALGDIPSGTYTAILVQGKKGQAAQVVKI